MCYIWRLCRQISKSIFDTSLWAACEGSCISAAAQRSPLTLLLLLLLQCVIMMVTHLISTEMFLSYLWTYSNMHRAQLSSLLLLLLTFGGNAGGLWLHLSIGAQCEAQSNKTCDTFLMKIASLRLEFEYLRTRQMSLTVYYGGELMQPGHRWSSAIHVYPLHQPSLTMDASAQMTFLGFVGKQNPLMKWIKMQGEKMDWPFGPLKVSCSVW